MSTCDYCSQSVTLILDEDDQLRWRHVANFSWTCSPGTERNRPRFPATVDGRTTPKALAS
jgi:hypothetical protein